MSMPSAADALRAQWLHDLRNAVNSTGLSLAVVRRLLETGDVARALQFLDDMEQGCQRCRNLVDNAPG